jgi:hypothetical protein
MRTAGPAVLATEIARTAYRGGGLTFWLVLLMPTWVPLFFGVGGQAGARPFLALIPAAWYFPAMPLVIEIPFPFSIRNITVGILAVVGSAVALAILGISLPGWRRILAVPLGVAIVAGTISVGSHMWF